MSDRVYAGHPTRGYEGFGGVVGELYSQSRPWWPTCQVARTGAPNVVLVVIDDLGFSDLGPFGSEIRTPAMDRLSRDGYRFSNYHSTPLCSPSRAALFTGLNPHRAGFAQVAHYDPGFPGYNLELAPDVATLAESFRAGGYATFMVGKWHLTKETNLHDGADRSSWPIQRGFDRYFGSMDGFTPLFHPHRLICDNSPVALSDLAEDAYLTDVLTDRALGMITSLRANDARKPFFLYFAHQAVHGPVQAKRQDIERYRGLYDAGWDEVRAARFARQVDSGLFPPGTRPSSSGPDETAGVPRWDGLSAEDRELFARHMEVYAAAVDAVDQSLDRIVRQLKAMGEYENTLIVVTSDNGATGEGGLRGTRSYFSQFASMAGLPEDWCVDVPRELKLMGGPQVHGHYPRGWAHVSNTPFRYYKGQTYAGGIHVPLVVAWPRGLARRDGDTGVRDQYAYVSDVAPTLLELAGVSRLAERQGLATQPVDGVSFAAVLRDGATPSEHRSQYVECGGQRGYFEDGYKIISPHAVGEPFTDDNWELYDIRSDPAETENIAAQHPELVCRLAQRWRAAAWANTVFPLDDTGRMLRVRPATDLRLAEPVDIYPGTPTLERFRSSRLTLLRSFGVDVWLHYARGDSGVIVSHGDQGGGYVLFVEDGQLRFSYNAYGDVLRSRVPDPIGEGPVRIGLRFEALEQMRWRIEILLAGTPVCEVASVPQLLGMAPFTGITVGADGGGPVDWELFQRHGCFRYSGELLKVRYTPGEKADYNPEIIVAVEEIAAREIE